MRWKGRRQSANIEVRGPGRPRTLALGGGIGGVIILLLVGIKMLLAGWLKNAFGEHFNLYLLTVVVVILAVGVCASLLAERNERLTAQR